MYDKLGDILDVIYGAFISYIIFNFKDVFLGKEHVYFVPQIVLIIIAIIIIEDYCGVKLVNSCCQYFNSKTFVYDILIAVFYFILFIQIENKTNGIIYFAIVINLLSFLWAIEYLRSVNKIDAIPEINKKKTLTKNYLKMTFAAHFLAFVILFGAIGYKFIFSHIKIDFDYSILFLCISIGVTQLFIMFMKIYKINSGNKEEADDLIRHSNPILTKIPIVFLLFIIEGIKKIVNALIGLWRVCFSS